MIIKKLEVGPIMANCYILGCDRTKQGAIIDPGDDGDEIIIETSKLGLNIKYIINTHGHFDHTGANKRVKEVTDAEIAIHVDDAFLLSQIDITARSFGLRGENSPEADIKLKDSDEISFGDIKLKVIHTPGHSIGGICLYTENHLFAGDTLFASSIGRTDLPGGDYDTLISSIKQKLFLFDDNTIVYTGHGPETTIGYEKTHNPFLI